MEIDYNEFWDLVTIVRDNCSSFRLDSSDQRKLLVWFCKNKPELIGEVVCIPDCAFLQENK